jgi:hypothetical protein
MKHGTYHDKIDRANVEICEEISEVQQMVVKSIKKKVYSVTTRPDDLNMSVCGSALPVSLGPSVIT